MFSVTIATHIHTTILLPPKISLLSNRQQRINTCPTLMLHFHTRVFIYSCRVWDRIVILHTTTTIVDNWPYCYCQNITIVPASFVAWRSKAHIHVEHRDYGMLTASIGRYRQIPTCSRRSPITADLSWYTSIYIANMVEAKTVLPPVGSWSWSRKGIGFLGLRWPSLKQYTVCC